MVKVIEERRDHEANGRRWSRRWRCRGCRSLVEVELGPRLYLHGFDVVAFCPVCDTMKEFWFVPGWVKKVLSFGPDAGAKVRERILHEKLGVGDGCHL